MGNVLIFWGVSASSKADEVAHYDFVAAEWLLSHGIASQCQLTTTLQLYDEESRKAAGVTVATRGRREDARLLSFG